MHVSLYAICRKKMDQGMGSIRLWQHIFHSLISTLSASVETYMNSALSLMKASMAGRLPKDWFTAMKKNTPTLYVKRNFGDFRIKGCKRYSKCTCIKIKRTSIKVYAL